MNQTRSTVVISALVSMAVVTGYAWLFKTDEFGTQIAIVDYDVATRNVDVRDPQAVDAAMAALRASANKLAANGFVTIDKRAVVSYPAELEVPASAPGAAKQAEGAE